VADYCEHCNEFSGSMKGGEFFAICVNISSSRRTRLHAVSDSRKVIKKDPNMRVKLSSFGTSYISYDIIYTFTLMSLAIHN